MNERPAPVSVFLTSTGLSHVFVWANGEDRARCFVAGCSACGWVADPELRESAEETANTHAHWCHYLPHEHWPKHLTDGM